MTTYEVQPIKVATCRAVVGSSWRYRCGKPTLPALGVCAEHIDRHGTGSLLDAAVDAFYRARGWRPRRDERPLPFDPYLVDGPDASVPSGPSSPSTSD